MDRPASGGRPWVPGHDSGRGGEHDGHGEHDGRGGVGNDGNNNGNNEQREENQATSRTAAANQAQKRREAFLERLRAFVAYRQQEASAEELNSERGMEITIQGAVAAARGQSAVERFMCRHLERNPYGASRTAESGDESRQGDSAAVRSETNADMNMDTPKWNGAEDLGDVEVFLAVDLARFPPFFGRAMACKASYQILLQIKREHRAAQELPWLDFCGVRFKGWEELPCASMASVFPPCQFFYYMLVALNGSTINQGFYHGANMYAIEGNETDRRRPPPVAPARVYNEDNDNIDGRNWHGQRAREGTEDKARSRSAPELPPVMTPTVPTASASLSSPTTPEASPASKATNARATSPMPVMSPARATGVPTTALTSLTRTTDEQRAAGTNRRRSRSPTSASSLRYPTDQHRLYALDSYSSTPSAHAGQNNPQQSEYYRGQSSSDASTFDHRHHHYQQEQQPYHSDELNDDESDIELKGMEASTRSILSTSMSSLHIDQDTKQHYHYHQQQQQQQQQQSPQETRPNDLGGVDVRLHPGVAQLSCGETTTATDGFQSHMNQYQLHNSNTQGGPVQYPIQFPMQQSSLSSSSLPFVPGFNSIGEQQYSSQRSPSGSGNITNSRSVSPSHFASVNMRDPNAIAHGHDPQKDHDLQYANASDDASIGGSEGATAASASTQHQGAMAVTTLASAMSTKTYKDHANELVDQMLRSRRSTTLVETSTTTIDDLLQDFKSMSVEELTDLVEVNHLLEFDAERATQLARDWDRESGRQSQDGNMLETHSTQDDNDEDDLGTEVEDIHDMGAASARADRKGVFPSLFTLSLRAFVTYKVDLDDLPEYIVEIVMSYFIEAVDMTNVDMRQWPAGTMMELARRAPGHLLMDIPHHFRAEREQPWHRFCQERFGQDYLAGVNSSIANLFSPCRIFYLLLQRESFPS